MIEPSMILEPSLTSECDFKTGVSTPDHLAAIIARSKGIIAGQIPAEPPSPDPSLVAFLEREWGNHVPSVSPEAIERLTFDGTLQVLYGGQPVACFFSHGRSSAVLAVGATQVRALVKALTDKERVRVLIEYP